eukprot:14150800-Alexandrium_andersonii.AAC.1
MLSSEQCAAAPSVIHQLTTLTERSLPLVEAHGEARLLLPVLRKARGKKIRRERRCGDSRGGTCKLAGSTLRA